MICRHTIKKDFEQFPHYNRDAIDRVFDYGFSLTFLFPRSSGRAIVTIYLDDYTVSLDVCGVLDIGSKITLLRRLKVLTKSLVAFVNEPIYAWTEAWSIISNKRSLIEYLGFQVDKYEGDYVRYKLW
jgi:hypothetical protein